MEKFTTYIAWVRVSTDEQGSSDHAGVDRQVASITRILADYPTAQPRWVHAIGVSGAHIVESREWQDEVAPYLGPKTLLIADSMSRLSRMAGFSMPSLEAIHRTRTWIATPGQLHDPNNLQGQLATAIGGVLGGYERANIMRQALDGKEAKRRKGMWVARPDMLATGISYDRKTKTWGYTSASEKVKVAFERVLSGESLYRVAQDLDWSPTRLRSVLKNEIYRGIQVWDKRTDSTRPRITDKGRRKNGPVIPREEVIRVRVFSPEVQLIPDDVWDQVQAVLRSKRARERDKRLSGRHDIPYTGYLVHHAPPDIFTGGVVELDLEKQTRHRMYGIHPGNGDTIRYACRCRDDKTLTRCDLPRWQAPEVNKALDLYLSRISSDPDFHEAVRSALTPQGDPKAKIQAAQKEIKDLETKVGLILDAYLETKFSKEVFTSRIDPLNARIERLKSEIQALEAQSTAGEYVDRVVEAVQEGWVYQPSWDTDTKRRWLARWVGGIHVSLDGIEGVSLVIPNIRLPGKGLAPKLLTEVTLSYGAASWASLLGYQPNDRTARRVAQDKLTVAEVAKRLGVTPHRITHARETGKLPEPTQVGRHYAWSEADLPAIKAALETPKEYGARHRVLQEEGWVTLGQLAKALGISETATRKRVNKGQLPPPDKVVGGGYRLWKPETLAAYGVVKA